MTTHIRYIDTLDYDELNTYEEYYWKLEECCRAHPIALDCIGSDINNSVYGIDYTGRMILWTQPAGSGVGQAAGGRVTGSGVGRVAKLRAAGG